MGLLRMDLSRRDLLIDDVQYGRKTPAEAEAEAVRLGLGPFARRPDPADFDPVNEAWWSLPMTIAWILWRSRDQVREYWDEYRIECIDWIVRPGTKAGRKSRKGHILKPRPRATLRTLLADTQDGVHRGPIRQVAPVSEAKETWDALKKVGGKADMATPPYCFAN